MKYTWNSYKTIWVKGKPKTKLIKHYEQKLQPGINTIPGNFIRNLIECLNKV